MAMGLVAGTGGPGLSGFLSIEPIVGLVGGGQSARGRDCRRFSVHEIEGCYCVKAALQRYHRSVVVKVVEFVAIQSIKVLDQRLWCNKRGGL